MLPVDLVGTHSLECNALTIEATFYNMLNPLMRALLRSPLHGVTSRNIALLHYRGRKSGRQFVTPLSYTRDGNVVRFLSSHRTRWWVNFRGDPVSVSVEIAKRMHPGKARLWDGDSEHLREGVRRFLAALPRDARVYGIKLAADRKPIEESLAKVVDDLVLVEVELD